jgi:hypothetical protein
MSTTFTAAFYLHDGLLQSVAIYCLDADRGGRYQTIAVYDVTNPDNPVLLDPARDVSDFATTGGCMVYNVSGHVQFTINLTKTRVGDRRIPVILIANRKGWGCHGRSRGNP